MPRIAPLRRDDLTDLGIAAALLVTIALSTVLYRVSGIFRDTLAPDWITVLWMPLMTLPLALRRRRPILVGCVLAAVFVAGGIARVPELLVGNVALFLGLYSIGVWAANRRTAALARAVIVVGMLIWLVVSVFQLATDPSALPGVSRAGAFSPVAAIVLIQVLTNVLYFWAAWFFGDRAWASAQERRVLRKRTAELERERERTATQSAALERLRIARELHDVVAHHVSVVNIHAGVARTLLANDPAGARRAIATVEGTSRIAIDELRGLLFTLREHRAPDADHTRGTAALPALVEASLSSGIRTSLTVVGDPHPLPAGLDVNPYRVAQEALTNVRKHAGADAAADVRLRYDDAGVELEIASTGRVAAVPSTSGLGLVGMRERVAASGGSLEAGPRSRGGWLVRARVPVSRAEADR